MNQLLQNKITKIVKVFDKFDNNVDIPIIKRRINSFLMNNQPIRLVCFTCSTINDKYLFSQTSPWRYVNLNPKGNNLEPDVPTLILLLNELNKAYPTELTVIIGNTDPFYIYSENFGIYKKLSYSKLWSKFAQRWRAYKTNLDSYLKSQNLQNYNLVSWYEIENQILSEKGIEFCQLFNLSLPIINNYFNKNDFKIELNRLREAFGKDKYFKCIKPPSDKVLKVWIKRKFTEYTIQGFFIYLFLPNSILLQNEKPSLLRTKMYQPLITKTFSDRLPVIYPFGVDNTGYQ